MWDATLTTWLWMVLECEWLRNCRRERRSSYLIFSDDSIKKAVDTRTAQWLRKKVCYSGHFEIWIQAVWNNDALGKAFQAIKDFLSLSPFLKPEFRGVLDCDSVSLSRIGVRERAVILISSKDPRDGFWKMTSSISSLKSLSYVSFSSRIPTVLF